MAISPLRRIAAKLLGVDVTITAPGASLDARLNGITARSRNLTPILTEFGEYVVERHIPNQFALQGSPAAFAPLSPAYALRKTMRYGAVPILYATGAMFRGFSYAVDKRNLKIMNKESYAVYHQTGTRRMPARKWLQLTASDYKVLSDITRRHLARGNR